jgi:hypothetical protein
LQNVNKDYIIFSYLCNFVAKSDQKPKTKNRINETSVGVFCKVQTLEEGHKFGKHFFSNFVAFSEYLNFNAKNWQFCTFLQFVKVYNPAVTYAAAEHQKRLF